MVNCVFDIDNWTFRLADCPTGYRHQKNVRHYSGNTQEPQDEEKSEIVDLNLHLAVEEAMLLPW